jgi:hypothetical protein
MTLAQQLRGRRAAATRRVGGLALGLALLVGGAPAVLADTPAKPGTAAPSSTATPAALALAKRKTDAALGDVSTAEKTRATLVGERDAEAKAYAAQLAAVDALKRQKASWRRDRQLREQLATSQAQAAKLAALDGKISAADAAIKRARGVAVAQIDAEAALLGGAGARRGELVAARARMAPAPTPSRRRIVLPDATIDPLADPEDLEAQAQLLRDAELELARAIKTLDGQAASLRRAAGLRAAHDRAGEVAARDDDGPRRVTGAGGGAASAAGAESDRGPEPLGADFAGEATAAVLRDVVDARTSDALRKADRVTDPATKADAAVRARSQAAARMAALAAQRAAIEARARELRK